MKLLSQDIQDNVNIIKSLGMQLQHAVHDQLLVVATVDIAQGLVCGANQEQAQVSLYLENQDIEFHNIKSLLQQTYLPLDTQMRELQYKQIELQQQQKQLLAEQPIPCKKRYAMQDAVAILSKLIKPAAQNQL